MSVFPGDLDSDVEIQRVDNNITEIGADTINALRDAIFKIQKTIGVNPQGNKSDLVSRTNVSIDANGLIKRSALESVGLVSLPITNAHVGTTAGIKESKLDLDHSTQTLRNAIDSQATNVSGLSNGLAVITSRLNTHLLGTGGFHDGYHIKINSGAAVGVAGLAATTIGAAVNEISGILLSGNISRVPHIDMSISSSFKHVASGIYVDPSGFVTIDGTITDLQAAVNALDSGAGALGVAHVDKFHANGISKEVNSGTYYNSRRNLLSSTVGAAYTGGTGVITIPGVVSFSSLNVSTGDILVIETQTGTLDVGAYQIRAAGPITSASSLGGLPVLAANELAVFHTFVESKVLGDGVSVSIFKPSESSSEFAPLACSARNSETIVDTVSILNPNAARVVSVGFNGNILNSDGYDVCIRVGLGGKTRELTIPNLNLERLGLDQSVPVSATSVAERINAYVSDPTLGYHFPITAYRVGNELAIAHNLVGTDYVLEILDGYTGNYALGLDAYGSDIVGQTIVGSESNNYSINGVELSTLKTVLSGYSTITVATSTLTLRNPAGQVVNPLLYGIGAGSVLHVTGHPTLQTNGSYTVMSANSTTISLFAAEQIDAPTSPTTFNILFTSSNVSLANLQSTETDLGIVQVLVDSSGETFAHQRLAYGNSLGSSVEIVGVTDGFPVGDVIISVTIDDNINFNIINDSVAGDTASINENFEGSFKLYHSNGIDYFTVNIIPGFIAGGIEVATVSQKVPQDEAFVLCTAHFNGTLSVTNLIDSRLFGNLGANQIRDDFIEIFSQRPISDLRSNGVVRGFDLMNLLYVDSITEMQAVPLRGGVAYINGVRVAVETQKVIIQSYDSDGNIFTNSTRVIGINDFGSIQVLSDELGELLTDGYNASSDFGKILPLYQVTITNGLIADIVDIRRFINNLDDKIDITVDETNNVVGNFRSLEGALLYASSYPDSEILTIKIINSVYPEGPLVVPNGVSIMGGAAYGGNGKHRIVNTLNGGQDFITLMGNNRLENVEILSTTAGLQGALVSVYGSNVNIEKCKLHFSDTISSNSLDVGIKVTAASSVRIVNNTIDNVYIGIHSSSGCNELIVAENRITGVSGVGVSSGIKIATASNSVENVEITNNIINIDSTAGTDLRGIFVDVGQAIGTLKISDNTISGALNLSSENNVSNGIRIDNVSSTGNKITQLTLLNNYVKNIKLHDAGVYGMYINDVEHALISGNTLLNIAVYDALYANTSLMWLDDAVDAAEINNNKLTASEALSGIYVNNTDTLVSIIGNTLDNIGDTSATYIYGTSHRANISDNKLVGPGNIGIWWKGERSKISNNHLSTQDNTVDYAFKTGIMVQASYVDVVNNTVTDMVSSGSFGIVTVNSANEGVKIIGNTVEGTTMSKLIALTGSYAVVSNNRLKNDVDEPGTVFIDIAAPTAGHSILGNTFEGVGSSCIYSAGAITNASITNNLILTTTLTSAPLRLADSGVANCIVIGNRLPSDSTYSAENAIGVTPSLGVYNENTIGVNRGLLDTRGIHASSGVTSYDSTGSADYSEYPHWVFNDSGSYWEVNSVTASDTRYLYFPIDNLPNGAILKSVEVQGYNTLADSPTFNATIYKRSVKDSNLALATISDTKDMSSAPGNFANGSGYGLINTMSAIDLAEVINYEESNYYVKIAHLKAGAGATLVYGLTVTFRY